MTRAEDYEARYHRLRNRIVVIVAVELAVLVVFMLFVGGSVLSTQQENHDALVILQDATTPGGKLYERGQSRTGEAVGALVARIDAGTLLILNEVRAGRGQAPLTELPTTPSKGP